jgi:hypothetical protein
MAKNIMVNQESVRSSAKLLSTLSKRDSLSIFMASSHGLKAESDTPHMLGLSKKTYYTRLKQLTDAGLITKSDGAYCYTTFGSVVYQKHLLGLIEEMKSLKQMNMVDTLKNTNQFTDDDIMNFVGKVTGINFAANAVSPKIEIVWTYEDMVSAIVERVEFCKHEIMLASRFLNEIIINNILRKSRSGVNIKVLADLSLVKQFFEKEKTGGDINDKNADERKMVVENPWYPDNVSRRITNVPFSMLIFDGKEVGIELIDSVEPTKFRGTIFLRDEKTARMMLDFYDKMWNSSSTQHYGDISRVAESNVSRRYLTAY